MHCLAQPNVYLVVHLAEVDHEFLLGTAREGFDFPLHFQEMLRAQLAGIHVAEESQKGIELESEFWSYFCWKAAGNHMENGPSHMSQFLPRYFVLPFLDDCRTVLPLFLVG